MLVTVLDILNGSFRYFDDLFYSTFTFSHTNQNVNKVFLFLCLFYCTENNMQSNIKYNKF